MTPFSLVAGVLRRAPGCSPFLAIALGAPAQAQDPGCAHQEHDAAGQVRQQPVRPAAGARIDPDLGDLKGDVYAVVDHPFATVQQALQATDHWCDILILHLNVKRCRAGADGKTINLNVGRKFDQPLEDAYRSTSTGASSAATADYCRCS